MSLFESIHGIWKNWETSQSYFQGNFRTFVEIKKRETNLSNLDISLKF